MSQPIEPRDPRHSNPYGLTTSPQEAAEQKARVERIWAKVAAKIHAPTRPVGSLVEGPVTFMTWEHLLAFPAHGSDR